VQELLAPAVRCVMLRDGDELRSEEGARIPVVLPFVELPFL